MDPKQVIHYLNLEELNNDLYMFLEENIESWDLEGWVKRIYGLQHKYNNQMMGSSLNFSRHFSSIMDIICERFPIDCYLSIIEHLR